jgi:hypothetical protein
MDQHTGGQHANAAIFAANGAARHRLLKAAGAVSLALLAAWLIALALGVWGGFGSLPGLPSFHSTGPSEASSRTQHPPAPPPPQSHPQSHQPARAVGTASPSPAGSGTSGTGSGTDSGSGTTDSQGSNPKATAPQPVESPSTSSAPPSTSQGQGTTTTTEVPTDSPGNLPSGSEMPGQLP